MKCSYCNIPITKKDILQSCSLHYNLNDRVENFCSPGCLIIWVIYLSIFNYGKTHTLETLKGIK